LLAYWSVGQKLNRISSVQLRRSVRAFMLHHHHPSLLPTSNFAGCLGLAISVQFILKMCRRPKSQKHEKNFLLGVQGHSRSSMLINLKSTRHQCL